MSAVVVPLFDDEPEDEAPRPRLHVVGEDRNPFLEQRVAFERERLARSLATDPEFIAWFAEDELAELFARSVGSMR